MTRRHPWHTCTRLLTLKVCWGIGVLTLCLISGCSSADETPTEAPREIRIATGNVGGPYHQLGEVLSRAYERTPDLRVTSVPLPGAVFKIQALEEHDADLALVDADLAYAAFARGTTLRGEPHTRLRGIAVVFARVLHIVVRADSSLHSLADLRAVPIGYGLPRTDDLMVPPFRYGDLVGIGEPVKDDIEHATFSLGELVGAVATNTIASGIVLTTYPSAPLSRLARDVGIRLIELGPQTSARLRNKDPFYKPVVIPKGTYHGQGEDIGTVGIDSLIVCRDDLDEDIAYRVAKTFFEDLPQLAVSWGVTLQFDPSRGAATPIPLHLGAARYYRERELLR